MTKAQLEAIIAKAGGLENLRTLTVESGKNYTLGPRGRYEIEDLDDANEVLTLRPKIGGQVNAYDQNLVWFVGIDMIEMIGIANPN